jgi:hypothetical protein
MSDRYETYDAPQDTGAPDQVETDPAALNSAEDLDEDRLHTDPLEAGMDPPEHWSAVDRRGMTPWEQAHPAPLDERLAEEEPDVGTERPAPAGVDRADTVETVGGVDAVDTVERPSPAATDENPLDVRSYDEDLGTSADVAGGSVADEIRTPPPAK